jgi:hypothetical protein
MTLTLVRPGAPGRRRSGGWFLAAAQYGYAGWFGLSVFLALKHAAGFAGHWYVPSANDSFTADADITAGWSWATLVILTVPSGVWVALLMLLTSGVVLFSGYTRGRRALTAGLIGSTVVMLLTLLAALTPAVQSVSGWLLD